MISVGMNTRFSSCGLLVYSSIDFPAYPTITLWHPGHPACGEAVVPSPRLNLHDMSAQRYRQNIIVWSAIVSFCFQPMCRRASDHRCLFKKRSRASGRPVPVFRRSSHHLHNQDVNATTGRLKTCVHRDRLRASTLLLT